MKCRQCGQEFEPTHGSQRYCSLVCRDRHSGRNTHSAGTEGICKECGATFTKSYGSEKYCSKECRKIYTDRHKDNGYVKKAPLAFVCEYCGRMAFTSAPPAKYCSQECKNKAGWRQYIACQYGSYEAYTDMLAQKEREREHQRAVKQALSEKRRMEWAQELARRREERERAKERYRIEHTYTRECVVCGNQYTTMNPAQKTCSKKCGKRLSQSRKHHRIPKEQIVDKDITLEALYRRDSGVCYLCGLECDWSDRDADANIVGMSYPSIDHVIPICRGGLHAWSNVRLAHFYCNTLKSDKLLEEIDEAGKTVGFEDIPAAL